MRIHYTGTIWHAGVSENFVRALRELGHDVFFFDKHLGRLHRVMLNLSSRLVRRPYEAENYFFETSSRRWLKSVKDYGPDLIFIEDAPNILADYIKSARLLGKPIFYFEHSPPQGAGAREVLASFECVDEVFCIDRGWIKYISMFFSGKTRHMPDGGNSWDFYPISEEKKIYDIVYVGSAPEQTPDGLLRAKLVDSIPEKYKVAVFGNGWRYWLRRFPRLKSLVKSFNAISNAEANLVYNRSKVALTFHSTAQPTSLGARTFDIALAGTFQIVDYRSDSDLEIFFPGECFAQYKSIQEMNALIGRFLQEPKKIILSSKRAREHALRHHTWQHRADEITAAYKNKYLKKI